MRRGVTRTFLLLFGALALLPAARDATAAVAAPSARYALPAPAARYTLEPAAIDAAAELRADADRPKSLPLRYAVERTADNVRTRPHAAPSGGEWRDLSDGMALWRIPVHVAGAVSLDFTFSHFFLPPGAQLFIATDGATLGPYGAADNPRSRRFATPLVHGNSARIEVLVPQAMKPYLDLELESVFAGYRDPLAPKSIANPQNGSGTCNIDTICSQGWTRTIRCPGHRLCSSRWTAICGPERSEHQWASSSRRADGLSISRCAPNCLAASAWCWSCW